MLASQRHLRLVRLYGALTGYSCCARSRRRTPGPPPFSGMKITPGLSEISLCLTSNAVLHM